MNKPKSPPRALPQGVVLCGWCDEFESRAKKAIGALRLIASYKCPGYCSGDRGVCTACIARRTLAELRDGDAA